MCCISFDTSRRNSEKAPSSKNGYELKKKIKDLELQLEYEINRHDNEIKEKEECIRTLEEKVNALENSKRESEEKDEAILSMSEQLLILSNKHDVLVKESKLQEEELKHLKNKKKYRNDKTNEFIITLKKQNDDFKKEIENLTDKYANLFKENTDLKCSSKLIQAQLEDTQKNLELVKKHSMEDFDEKSAIKILNLGTELVHKRNSNKDFNEDNGFKMEMEYKDMIIKKLLRNRMIMEMTKMDRKNCDDNYKENGNTSGKGCQKEEELKKNDSINHNGEQLITYEKKLEELYQKCIDSQIDNDKLKKKIKTLNDHINDLKKENTDLMGIIDTLKEYISKAHREDVNVQQFDDLINNLLKENSTLNNELSKQKRKNMADTYFFNKELQLIQSDKLKIIEKFDESHVMNFPHLYEPLTVTLNESQHEYLNKTNGNRETAQDHTQVKKPIINKDEKETAKISHLVKSNQTIITDELVHTYMEDYMKNVQNKN
ncbi:hypothetical protein, conserved [Plasmodium gonderi]|uniref:Uncharacterized protein n=1 Tax=Plasmodium gonderi TaxID=77519 RepID=A0A1Y1JNJ8_PLAGO|nr:hypothetical protein, conserved [Plasmodium gonderi]GAW83025.1 hypothetical protein, conserved [Plasmodium gonderi]